MSLLDALLLDPPRIDVYIALRVDSQAGTGTQADPYNGSTATLFDALMNNTTKVPNYSCVHLGPGVFSTAGYSDSTGTGWQVRPGLSIVGSGIDVTTLKISPGATSATFYAVGHAITSTTMDHFLISDLTLDCSFSGMTAATVATGGIRVMGNHARAERVKVKDWGNKGASTSMSFVIAMLTGDPTAGVAGVVNCGMEECIVVPPAGLASITGRVNVLHVGAKESPVNSSTTFGIAPYIRNCYVDGGGSFTTTKLRALSMAWCKSGVVENNQISNIAIGGPCSQASAATGGVETGAEDITVRGNTYRNVAAGPFWVLTTTGSLKRLVVEDNTIELTELTVNILADFGVTNRSAFGVCLYDWVSGNKAFGSVELVNNRIRYLAGAKPTTQTGSGTYVTGATNLLVRESVLDLMLYPGQITTTPPLPAGLTNLSNKRCTNVSYFENRTPSGQLVQGFREDDNSLYTELATDAEEAFMLQFLLRA